MRMGSGEIREGQEDGVRGSDERMDGVAYEAVMREGMGRCGRGNAVRRGLLAKPKLVQQRARRREKKKKQCQARVASVYLPTVPAGRPSRSRAASKPRAERSLCRAPRER